MDIFLEKLVTDFRMDVQTSMNSQELPSGDPKRTTTQHITQYMQAFYISHSVKDNYRQFEFLNRQLYMDNQQNSMPVLCC